MNFGLFKPFDTELPAVFLRGFALCYGLRYLQRRVAADPIDKTYLCQLIFGQMLHMTIPKESFIRIGVQAMYITTTFLRCQKRIVSIEKACFLFRESLNAPFLNPEKGVLKRGVFRLQYTKNALLVLFQESLFLSFEIYEFRNACSFSERAQEIAMREVLINGGHIMQSAEEIVAFFEKHKKIFLRIYTD